MERTGLRGPAKWAPSSVSANHYVASGSTGGDGSDRSHALSDLPATLVRGDTYYVAAGLKRSKTLGTAQSGTTQITIRGATVADHGTNTGGAEPIRVCGRRRLAGPVPRRLDRVDRLLYHRRCVRRGSANNGLTMGYGFRTRSDATGSGAIGFTLRTTFGMTMAHYEIDGVSATSLSPALKGPRG